MKRTIGLSILLSLFSSEIFASGGFTWLGGMAHSFHIPEHSITFTLIGLFLVLIGLIYRSKISKVSNVVIPDKGITFRNIVELYGNFIYGQCKQVIGEKEAPTYFPFIATVFIVILLSNLIGLIPGFLPPTEYLSTTLALGVFSFIYYNVVGCKEQGVVNYVKHFAGPLWYLAVLIFPIEIISNCIRPLSLALRLRSNMMGDHIVLTQFSDLAPLIIPIVFMILGILVSFIQAYVFTVLTMVYIQMAVAHHDHEEGHAH
jgi:F-type H+-transporting ATPase subunit a